MMTHEDERRAEAVIDFWFGECEDPEIFPDDRKSAWWKKDAVFDSEIRDRFGADIERLAAGDLEHWTKSPRACLAYIIIADQFSRNVFRDTARAFALDDKALAAARAALEVDLDRALHTALRLFVRMPLMHSEDEETQHHCVASFEALQGEAPEPLRGEVGHNVKFAEQHRDIVLRFGRFPHRNAVLSRPSTDEELAFLETPGSSF